jgi:hypothetical protein
MGVRVYGSQAIEAAQAKQDAQLAETVEQISTLLEQANQHAAIFGRPAFLRRRAYPADARWNAERRRDRRRRWLKVGNPDGSGFTRRPGPYRLPAQCTPDDGHTVVWFGKDISTRFDGEQAAQATTPGPDLAAPADPQRRA